MRSIILFVGLWMLLIGGCGSQEQVETAASPSNSASSSKVCARKTKDTSFSSKCNGSSAACSKRFDQVTFPMTHNSMSNSSEGWLYPNQTYGIQRQLQDGIRGFMLDTYYLNPSSLVQGTKSETLEVVNQVYLCHVFCSIGRRLLVEGLCDLVNFLDANPGEILSIIFEDYVSAEDTAQVMEAAGLTEYVYSHSVGTAWPTLREMIESNKRLVVFTETPRTGYSWMHSAWDQIWDTKYRYTSTQQFDCATNRGSRSNSLFLMNHWLSSAEGLPQLSSASTANDLSVLSGRVQSCYTDSGRYPTFIGVDGYDQGALLTLIQSLNGS